MKILYISYDGMTDPLGQSQVIPYLIGLSKKNQITILSCEKKDRYEKQHESILRLLNQHAINWIPVSYSTLPSVLSKQWNIARLRAKAVSFYNTEKPDVVHCRSYMAALIGSFLKKKYGVKFIFDMRGFWADERIEGNIWTTRKFIHRKLYAYFKKKETDFLCNADYTVSLTENAKKEIVSWKQLKNKSVPIEVIPCCADLEHFSLQTIEKKNMNQLRQQLNISQDDFVISYLGSIGTWYMLDEMLDFFSCILEQYPKAKFLFITPDSKKDIIEKAREKGIDTEKLIVSFADRKDVPLYLSLSVISLYFIRPTYSKKASSPTKTAEILGLGIPIITNSGVGDSAELLERSATGLIVKEFSKDDYRATIKQFSVLLSTNKQKMIDVAHNHFSLQRGVELYQSIYDKIENTN